jgi:glycosyltransferase involved in cell wall biosynthesis
MTQKTVIIELFYSYFENNSFSKMLREKGCDTELFALFKKENKLFFSKLYVIWREFICLLKLCFKLHLLKNNTVFCLGAHYSVLIMCKLFHPYLGKNFRLYIYNFYLHDAGSKKIVRFILRFLLNNPACTLIVQSPKEVEYYKKLTGIPVLFVPYCAGIEPVKEKCKDDHLKNFIFTGGYSNRDYSIVYKCALAFPDEQFVIVVSHLNTDFKGKDLPANIILYEDISHDDFDNLLSLSKMVLVPLKSDVGASGQMLCIGAMQNKKPVIYSDISSVNYYFRENDSGLPYTMGDEKSMIEQLNKLIHDTEYQNILGMNAYNNYINNFTLEQRDSLLFNILSGKNE